MFDEAMSLERELRDNWAALAQLADLLGVVSVDESPEVIKDKITEYAASRSRSIFSLTPSGEPWEAMYGQPVRQLFRADGKIESTDKFGTTFVDSDE